MNSYTAQTPRSRSSITRLHLLVIVFYGLIAFLVLNRLLFNASTLVPSGPLNDYDQFTWNNWWIGYALGTLHVDPYFTNYILYPFQHNLSMHALTPILYPIYAVLHPFLSDPATMNVILWGSFVATGTVTFVFVRRFTANLPAALIGGLIFMVSPAMIDHAVNFHANLWFMFWFPAILLLWDRVAVTESRSKAILWALIFGLGMWGLWMTDLEFLIWSPFIVIPFGILTLVQAKSPERRIRVGLLGILSMIVMSALLLISPLPALLKGDPVGITSPAGYSTVRRFSMPLSALLFAPGDADRGIGRVIVAATLIALFVRPKRPIRWFWFAIAIPPLILALGSDVQIAGAEIPLPYRVLHSLFNGLYRWPSRFAPLGTLALIIFVGLSFRRWRYSLSALLVLMILIDGNLLSPFPVEKPVEDYAIYHQIGAEQDNYVVLFVPMTAHSGWAQVGGILGQRAQYLQIYTHKPQINGGLSRIPDIEHTMYEQPPLYSFLSGTHEFIKEQPPFDAAAASNALSQIIRDWPIGYVTIHLSWLEPERILPILGFFNTQPDLCLISQEKDVIAYRARSRGCPNLAPQGETEIQFGSMGDERYLIEGFYARENIGGAMGRWSRATVRLIMPLDSSRNYTLTLRALAFGKGRTVTANANGHDLGTLTLTDDWSTQTIQLPAAALDPSGDLIVTLQANGEGSPAQSGSADERILSVAYQWLKVTPEQK